MLKGLWALHPEVGGLLACRRRYRGMHLGPLYLCRLGRPRPADDDGGDERSPVLYVLRHQMCESFVK